MEKMNRNFRKTYEKVKLEKNGELLRRVPVFIVAFIIAASLTRLINDKSFVFFSDDLGFLYGGFAAINFALFIIFYAKRFKICESLILKPSIQIAYVILLLVFSVIAAALGFKEEYQIISQSQIQIHIFRANTFFYIAAVCLISVGFLLQIGRASCRERV